MNSQIKQKLNSINWDFSDYNSLKYPLDLNSVHWYLASFPPLIPMYLISLLSSEGDIIFDPFGGAGTTAIKALELNRKFVYNDINPFAVDIIKAKVNILKYYSNNPDFVQNEGTILDSFMVAENEVNNFIRDNGVDVNIKDWYEPQTLTELCSISNMIFNDNNTNKLLSSIRRCAFSSILKGACSQTDHITYITDNCRPKRLIYKNARKLYLDQISVFQMAAADFFKRNLAIFGSQDSIERNLNDSIINSGDSRNMNWLEDSSVDMVITSPPYLCAQDYIKSMRLTNMFFQNNSMKEKLMLEIGARKKRSSNPDKTVNEYYKDIECSISEISRVLKPGKFFCLVIGQGSGKITREFDIIRDISNLIQKKYGFSLEHEANRNITSRRIHVGGISKENILIFKKKETEVYRNGI